MLECTQKLTAVRQLSTPATESIDDGYDSCGVVIVVKGIERGIWNMVRILIWFGRVMRMVEDDYDNYEERVSDND